MKTFTRGLLTGVLALAATAAGAAGAEAQDGELTFAYTQSQSDETPESAEGGTGSIAFAGSLTTPTPCYEVSAAHTVRGSRVTLTVTAAGTGGMCVQVITHNNYEGAVGGLDAGEYTFEIVHRTGDGRGETVLSETVVVQ